MPAAPNRVPPDLPATLGEPDHTLRAILDASLDAFILIDAFGTVRIWNKRAEVMFGWTADEAVGQRLSQTIIPERYRERHDEGLAHYRATGEGKYLNRRVEVTARHRDGLEFPVELTIAPLEQTEEPSFVAFVRDITERRQIEEQLALDVSERKRVSEELLASHEQLRELAHRLRAVREQERAVMARQIHDELGQALSALHLDVAWLRARLKDADVVLEEKTRSMASLIETSIGRVRALATELRPAVLDSLGLLAAIEWETQQFTRRTGIPCNHELPVEPPLVDADRSTDVFRILQEALTNVARHAGAREVVVTLRFWRNELQLSVSDDGRGITAAEIASPQALGLVGMRERAFLWDGVVEWRPRDGGGTVVDLRLPLANGRQKD